MAVARCMILLTVLSLSVLTVKAKETCTNRTFESWGWRHAKYDVGAIVTSLRVNVEHYDHASYCIKDFAFGFKASEVWVDHGCRAQFTLCTACSATTWGPDCENTCNCNTDHTEDCGDADGICSCKAGWTGETCNERCSQPYYGPNCANKCNCERRNTVGCSVIDGRCECKDAWTGDTCAVDVDECSKTGDEAVCTSPNQICHNLKGSYKCVHICKPGWTGELCSEACSDTTWGPDCENTCTCDLEHTADCGDADGICSCKAGWTGETCNEEKPTPYGSSCVNPSDCNFAESDCVEGQCRCHVSHVYDKQSGACVTQCKTYGSDYVKYPNHYMSQDTPLRLPSMHESYAGYGPDPVKCMDECTNTKHISKNPCKSFNLRRGRNDCVFSAHATTDLNYIDNLVEDTRKHETNEDYFQRQCGQACSDTTWGPNCENTCTCDLEHTADCGDADGICSCKAGWTMETCNIRI